MSTPALTEYFRELDITLPDDARAEVGLAARDWMSRAASRLQRGFAILIDYGHTAPELYSAAHAAGTLTTFSRHTIAGPDAGGAPSWLLRPGERDITAHVDFTTVQRVAEQAGLMPLGFLDQTYFLMALLKGADLDVAGTSVQAVQRRLALKTLLLPGGLGSTMKVLLLGKNVDSDGVRPRLTGCASRMRVT